MPENRHKCYQWDLLGMFYKHFWNKPAKEHMFPLHLNSWSWFCFQKMERYNCFERSESPGWDGGSFNEASPLFDIFLKKWQAFGECGQGKWCASSKEQGFFLEWACCPEAELICILSAVHLIYLQGCSPASLCLDTALSPRRAVSLNLQCSLVEEPVFSSSYHDVKKINFPVGPSLPFQGHLERELK